MKQLSKKAKLDFNKVDSIVTGIFVVVIILAAYGAIIPEAQTAGNRFNVTSQCTDNGCYWNSTACNADVTNATLCDNSGAIPLAGLFDSKGVLLLIIMAAFVILIVRQQLKSRK